jgi:hypothetical protein
MVMPSRVLVLLLFSGFLLLSPEIALAQATGDINGDGKVDTQDVTILEQYLKGSRILEDQELQQADVNQDAKVDSKDLDALQRRLGILSPNPSGPIQTNQRVNRDESSRVSREGNANTLQVGISEVVPEWVRGEWSFSSTVLEDRGFNDVGRRHNEQITLPGDLSGQYQSYSDTTGERLERQCWQVMEFDDRHFVFVEQSRFPSSGAFVRSTSTVTRLQPNQAQIRVRVDVLDPGRGGQGAGSQGLLGALFGAIFGQQSSRNQVGDYYVREGNMIRTPGTEQKRLPDVDLSRLRCS